ncbi:helix-turn-helix transcriptional regulator [Lentzea albidocapillata]|uniref:DNA-binding transcriptional regulator, XRE-family HTH domain n=1 Tax=Lentzea albidocapillata TaxID=40571 RepID=A0A1W2FFU0_9PSEU|nr:helix-turn-helix transcriptional regulator [Lentzea albidocapillata]SMD20542.1 DNA-binding transcriptional regulator, XRE-family HTH domain [Lentzea albidocapillata]
MTLITAARTVLGLRIQQSRLTFEELAEQVEIFARESGEIGTLSPRHVQRLCAGKLTPEQLRAPTVRLLERYFESSIEELLAAPQESVAVAGRSGSRSARASSALAVARQRKGHSQESFAEEVGVAFSTVGRWERGECMPQPWKRPAIARVLGISIEQLAILIESTGEVRCQVDRRVFLETATGAVLSMATTFRPVQPTRAGESDWRHLLDRTARLRRLDNYLGGRDTYDVYASELESTVHYVRSVNCSSKIHTALVGVISEQAQMAGWAAFDAGMQAEAKRHYRDSLKAAEEAKDAALAGNALAFLAYQEVSTTGPNIGLAEASYAAAEKDATPKVRALLLERKAWTYAVAGDHLAAEHALADARSALEARCERAEPDWVFWVDDNEIEIMAGRCWAELRRPLRAVATLDAALARFDDTHARDKALYMTSLAHALIDGEEIERAALVTQECARLAQGVSSVRPWERIDGVVKRLQEFKASAVVSHTIEQVRH